MGTRITGNTCRMSISVVIRYRARAGAHRVALPSPEPPPKDPVVGEARRRRSREEGLTSPPGRDLPYDLLLDFGRRTEGVVGTPGRLRVRGTQHEGRRPLGIGGREKETHGAAFGKAEQGRALGAARIEHGAQIVELLLEGREHEGTIGEAHPALVEDNDPREGGQALDEVRVRGQLPQHFHVGRETERQDQVARAAADHLVGDVDVTAPRISRFWRRHRAECALGIVRK